MRKKLIGKPMTGDDKAKNPLAGHVERLQLGQLFIPSTNLKGNCSKAQRKSTILIIEKSWVTLCPSTFYLKTGPSQSRNTSKIEA